jgi:putative ABC transport system permease protein
MSRLTQLWRRILHYVRRDRFDRELEEEVRFHLEMKAEEYAAAGMSPDEARRAARRQFGNETRLREMSRETWGFVMLETLIQDVRYGARVLAKYKGFTAVAVLTLALGIGMNTAIFSVVNAVLLRPLPYEDSHELVQIWGTLPQLDTAPMSPANFLDWVEQNRVFERIAAYTGQNFNLSGVEEPERIRAMRVSAGLFELLRAQPALGRTFSAEEDQHGGQRVVILSHALWHRRFGADPKVVGQTLTLNDQSYVVVGVMPPTFAFPRATTEMWTPIAFSPGERGTRDTNFLSVIARLKPGVTLEQARSEMGALARRQQEQYPESNTGVDVKVISYKEQIVGDTRPILLLLLGAVGFVLLIACANVASLLLARATARRKEMAIRSALGASRRRVVRQLLTESVLLALAGGGLGTLLAFWGLDLLVALQPANIPRLTELSIDRGVLLFALALSLLTGIAFGLAPAQQASKLDFNDALKEGGKGAGGGGGRQRLRSLLVVSEISLSFVLLVGAGLMVKSFWRLIQVEPGFEPENTLTMVVSLPTTRYAETSRQVAFFQQAVERVGKLPGVEAAGVTTDIPLFGGSSTGFDVEGRPPYAPGQRPLVEFRSVSPGYFRAMGITLLRGRAFTEQDRADAPGVVIINETLARRYFPDEDPLGKRLGLSRPTDWREIVGVARDTRNSGLDEEVKPEAYLPYTQSAPDYLAASISGMVVVARTTSDPQGMAAAVKREVQGLDRNQPVYNIKTMEQYLADSIAQRRFNMLLLAVFAGVAVLLAVVGLYGMMSYTVLQRTHEIGLRMALGAQGRDILRMAVRQGLVIILIGIAVGLAGALALTRVMSGLLYGVGVTDPPTFAAIASLLAFVSLLACYIPARRATKVDPLIALRYE